MNKLHYVNTDETHKKSADLRFDNELNKKSLLL